MVKQVRAARTRQTLIVAAAEMFADVGYASATLPAISKRAGVSSGALHFHFASKDSLAAEVEAEAAESVRELADNCRFEAATFLQALVDTTCRLLLVLAADPVVRAGFRLSGDPSRKGGAEMLHWWRALVYDLITQAERAGELAHDVSSEAAMVAIVAATLGFQAAGAADRAWLAAERVAQFWTFILPRLAASPDHGVVPTLHVRDLGGWSE
ncbi:ScbR family autoregulator-binding transcription factor [Streptomyces sp. TLI_185]|uniref:ScbR family autoregulator-binding transcription factor n=1 Tax=Streptomyces sp. TLI_185 TaxID=2485151 RepID=UPI000F4FB432|nr:ScbR family autoregulator-binding transcription factor [Streptomyces sp. TLI_185]RPF24791.1 TetR family transcriptional regulator [Streptomyces sp. TLI_185]